MTELRVDVQGNVARLSMNRPAVLNALSPDLLQAIVDAAGELQDRDDVSVVLLSGEGSSFSSGADLPAHSEYLDARSKKHADLGRRAGDALANLPQITLAAIHGHCVGGAVVMAAACDLRTAADSCKISLPEVDAGIPLAWGGMGNLVRLIGETRATELVLSCRRIGAQEALDAGFLTDAVPESEFEAHVEATLAGLSARPPAVLRMIKQQLIDLRNGQFKPEADADALLAAFHDPEARAAGQRYLKSRIKKR